MQNESIGPPAVADAACLEGLFMPANGLLLVLIGRLPGNMVLPNRLRENELFVKPELYAPPARSGGVRASEFSFLET